jgi:hypothetical protein
MANRHQRRRAVRISTRMISIEELMATPCLCAWAGCGKSTNAVKSDGWSNMLLYKGETRSDFMKINLKDSQRDCVLCPEHARYLDAHLLIDIGGHLRPVAGTA